jgi:hypothetical protein
MGGDACRKEKRMGGKTVDIHRLFALYTSYISFRGAYRELKNSWWGVPEVFDRQDVMEVGRSRSLHTDDVLSNILRSGTA